MKWCLTAFLTVMAWLRVVRAAALCTFSASFLVLGVLGMCGAFGQTLPDRGEKVVDIVQYEHRMTALETTVAAIAEYQNSQRNYTWVQLIGLSGLLGEAGIRVAKQRQQKKGEGE